MDEVKVAEVNKITLKKSCLKVYPHNGFMRPSYQLYSRLGAQQQLLALVCLALRLAAARTVLGVWEHALILDLNDDLTGLLVGLHIVLRLRDLIEWENLVDYRFELAALQSFIDIFLAAVFRCRIACDLEKRIPANCKPLV
jgi:hypothetical protein